MRLLRLHLQAAMVSALRKEAPAVNTNLAYISALTAALQDNGVDVTDGRPGPWGSWSLELRYGWVEDSLEVWATTENQAHAAQVAVVVAGLLREKLAAVLN